MNTLFQQKKIKIPKFSMFFYVYILQYYLYILHVYYRNIKEKSLKSNENHQNRRKLNIQHKHSSMQFMYLLLVDHSPQVLVYKLVDSLFAMTNHCSQYLHWLHCSLHHCPSQMSHHVGESHCHSQLPFYLYKSFRTYSQ